MGNYKNNQYYYFLENYYDIETLKRKGLIEEKVKDDNIETLTEINKLEELKEKTKIISLLIRDKTIEEKNLTSDKPIIMKYKMEKK